MANGNMNKNAKRIGLSDSNRIQPKPPPSRQSEEYNRYI
jgi:hypothetical protein